MVHDRSVAPGPAAKQGRQVRGYATLDQATGTFQLTVERRSHWSGITTWSEDVAPQT